MRAERTLGRPSSTARLETYLDHALETGFDEAVGGLDTHPSRRRTDRIWWVQAEMLACLTEAVELVAKPDRYARTASTPRVHPEDAIGSTRWALVGSGGSLGTDHHRTKAP
jgi:hypothetical protein